MSSGAEPAADNTIKMLLTGDSGTGKTGGLTSLLLDGYKLRIVNIDPGTKINILLHLLHHSKSPYYSAAKNLNLADALRYETVNHKMITIDVGKRVRIQPSAATVWPRVEKLVHEWREDSGVYLGPISSWGPDTVLVLDTFTFAGFAALFYIQELNNQLGVSSGNAWRRCIGDAQDELDKILRLVCSDSVKCHVIITTHINYLTESWQKEDSDDRNAKKTKVVTSSATDVFGSVVKAYPTAIGRALGPRIGGFFNNVIEMKVEGIGPTPRRRYYTIPTGSIAVKTSAPYALKDSYDISTGLAEIFAAIRGTKPKDTQEKPTQEKPTQ